MTKQTKNIQHVGVSQEKNKTMHIKQILTVYKQKNSPKIKKKYQATYQKDILFT